MNKNHKLKVALLAVAAIAAASSAQAQAPGDLFLGFTTSSSTGDLVVDLGTYASLATGAQSLGFTLNSELSSLYGGNGGVSFGVVGGKYNSGSSYSIYSTVPHGATAPTYGAPGTLASAANTAGSNIGDGTGPTAKSSVTDPTAGTGTSWTEQIDKSTSLWQKNSTPSPDSKTPTTFTTGSVVEDLYKDINGAESLAGTITLQSTGELDFSPATAVPEPATYGLLSGLGVLALAIRRQFVRKSA